MRRSVVLVALTALFAALFTMLATTPAHAVDRDCGDFDTQRQAQNFFLNQGGPDQDPHALDADGDGIACESLHCPCSTNTGGGGAADGGGGGTGGQTLHQRARVIRVIDGDTVRVKLTESGTRRDVRMIGIDTPEVFGGTECGGPEASASLTRMLPVDQRVTLVSDPTQDLKDRYDRLLRYVTKPSGVDTGRMQLRAGWARVYVYDNNPFKRVGAYRTARDEARNADRGIWGTC